MEISLIAAMDRNRLIGAGNRLPWRLPADLAHFKALTLGKPVLMGRKTFESIGRPLPGRENLVLSRDPAFAPEGVRVVRSIDEACAVASAAPELMVAGGASLYALLLPRATRLCLTFIEAEFEGDAWFPEYDTALWVERSIERHAPDERNPWAYRFVTLGRRSP